MAPYGQLSRGEQSRADLARVLAHGVSEDQASGPLIVEEFTSLLDRTTAKALVSRMQVFLRRHPLPPLVLVSCHEDFVGVGMLEPQWVFETCPSCLSRLKVPRSARSVTPLASEPDAAEIPAKRARTERPVCSSASSSSRKRAASPGPGTAEAHVVLKRPARQATGSVSVWESVPRC